MVFTFRPTQRPMPLPCQTARTALDLIGSTPAMRLNRLPQLEGVGAQVWAKLENLNPGGSVKDRICRAMIEAAERDGVLTPGGTIIEPTSGNTGIGLALVAAVKGYRLLLTMPDTNSEERRSHLLAYGAPRVVTPHTKGIDTGVPQHPVNRGVIHSRCPEHGGLRRSAAGDGCRRGDTRAGAGAVRGVARGDLVGRQLRGGGRGRTQAGAWRRGAHRFL